MNLTFDLCFSHLLQPNLLCECLFRAFASDINQRVDIEVFMSTLAVSRSDNQQLWLRFLFRVFDFGTSYMSRKGTEEILNLAYGDSLRQFSKRAIAVLEELFSRKRREVSFRDFEEWNGNVDILSRWVRITLDAFFETKPPNLRGLYRRYTALFNSDIILNDITPDTLTKEVVDSIRQQFVHLSSSWSGRGSVSLRRWLIAANPTFIHPHLAELAFLTKTEPFKPDWKLQDFSEFLITFARLSAVQRSRAVFGLFTTFAAKIIDLKLLSHYQTSSLDDALGSFVAVNALKEGGVSPVLFAVWLYMLHLLHLEPSAISPALDGNSIAKPKRSRSRSLGQLALGNNEQHEEEEEGDTVIDSSRSKDKNGTIEVTSRLRYHTHTMLLFIQLLANQVKAVKEGKTDEISVPVKSFLTQAQEVVSTPANHTSLHTLIKNILLELYLPSHIPGLRDLGLLACCGFGIQPETALREKEFVTELTIRFGRNLGAGGGGYGPVGTEWCVISRSWLDRWQRFVGGLTRSKSPPPSALAAGLMDGTMPGGMPGVGLPGGLLQPVSPTKQAYTMSVSALPPSKIDNWSILSAQQSSDCLSLRDGVVIGMDIEIIPPIVFMALEAWYGGGPVIHRRVIHKSSGSNKVLELELFPLKLTLIFFTPSANYSNVSNSVSQGKTEEMLFSRSLFISEAIAAVCDDKGWDNCDTIRLWNYQSANWKEQVILPLDMTLDEAGIVVDNQKVLVEIQQADGSWPRSQLHTRLLDQEAQSNVANTATGNTASSSSKKDINNNNSTHSSTHSVSTHLQPLNDGLVGLDNLGNTCYLNASIQALVHSDIFAEYFATNTFLKDLNLENKHGYKGRLALVFGKVTHELWMARNHKYIAPRAFYREICQLNDQYAGNEQHDAHEFLSFLLDGLSEDLNAVHVKPYLEMPDSNDTPEKELANIWWTQHMRRERSLITHLFTGQFRSSLSCACGYCSARFEPFTVLSLPIPEDTTQVVHIILIPRDVSTSIKLVIRMSKVALIADIVSVVISMKLPALASYNDSSIDSKAVFLFGELHHGRIKSFIANERKMDSLRDGEVLAMFQVAMPHRKPLISSHQAAATVDDSSSDEDAKPADEPQDNVQVSAQSSKKTDQVAAIQAPQAQAPAAIQGAVTEHKSISLIKQAIETQHSLDDNNSNSSSSDHNHAPMRLVRIAFAQRRVRYVDGEGSGLGGFDLFQLEPFGLPLLEVLPNRLSCGVLYAVIEERVRGLLKGEVSDLLRRNASEVQADKQKQLVKGSVSSDELAILSPPITSTKQEASLAVCERINEVSSFTTDEVLGGPIPKRGFTLRLVNGGSGSGLACSQCPWLQRCEGCILPDNDSVIKDLQDGESIAIDWHYAVFEELLDLQLASAPALHESYEHHRQQQHQPVMPLDKCLDKFSEQEKIDDVVCPRCKSNDSVHRSMLLWRLPILLVVQLKRFQFDRSIRRKIHQPVDFPYDCLDLCKYLAPGRLEGMKVDKETLCSEYRLYAVIHHLGALGGGHYVATVKQKHQPLSSDQPAQDSSCGKEVWHCFNDHVVTVLQDINELKGGSAYLLFYARRDIDQVSLEQILEQVRIPASVHSEQVQQQQPPQPDGVALTGLNKKKEANGKAQSQSQQQQRRSDEADESTPPRTTTNGLARRSHDEPVPHPPQPPQQASRRITRSTMSGAMAARLPGRQNNKALPGGSVLDEEDDSTCRLS